MKKLHLIDDTFLRLENRRQPLHIGTLLLFQLPARARKDFVARIAEKLRSSEKPLGVYNQRLVEQQGKHYWEANEDFDLEHHFVHLALPAPGRVRELLAMVSRLHCGHLDRAYPLWRIYLIEGLEDGRVAIYLKIHHSMIDGVSGMKMLMESMSTTASESVNMPPFWEVERRRKKGGQVPVVPAPATTGLVAMRAAAREGLKVAAPVMRQLRGLFKDYRDKHPDLALAGAAPRTVFNQPISGTRRFAAQSYSAPRIKAVAKAFDSTRNDVVLAMVASALRKYLIGLGELPERPLTGGVPVSIRGKIGSGKGSANEVAFVIANLATQIEDPVERMRAIKRSMDYNKEKLTGLSSGQTQAFATLSLIPGAINMLLGRKSDNTLGNVVVSHVPGPRQDLYWQGMKLVGMYPISLLIDGCGLNITIVSRHDLVDFGIIACRKTVPHVQRLLDYLEAGLVELEKSVPEPSGKKAPKSKKRSATKHGKAAAGNKRAKKPARKRT